MKLPDEVIAINALFLNDIHSFLEFSRTCHRIQGILKRPHLRQLWLNGNGSALFHVVEAANLLDVPFPLNRVSGHLAYFFDFVVSSGKEFKCRRRKMTLLDILQEYKFTYYMHYHLIPHIIRNTLIHLTNDEEQLYELQEWIRQTLSTKSMSGQRLSEVLWAANTAPVYGEPYLNHLVQIIAVKQDIPNVKSFTERILAHYKHLLNVDS